MKAKQELKEHHSHYTITTKTHWKCNVT